MLTAVKTPGDHRAALARIDALMEAEAGSPETAELEVLAILVQKYEREAFPIDPPSPFEAIEFRMEQMGYTQADLARLLGSRSRASEILRGSLQRLSLAMIRRLHEKWHIPAEALIRNPAPRSAIGVGGRGARGKQSGAAGERPAKPRSASSTKPRRASAR